MTDSEIVDAIIERNRQFSWERTCRIGSAEIRCWFIRLFEYRALGKEPPEPPIPLWITKGDSP